MRIIIDLQGAQTQSRYRGIGRYSMSIARAIARNAGKHEIIIALSDRFPDTIMPIRQEFSGLVSPGKIVVFSVPGPIKENNPENSWRVRVAELIWEHLLQSLNPDVVFVTSLFEGFADDFAVSIQSQYLKRRTSVIVYDLIPLLKKNLFLTNSIVENWYMRKIDSLKNASLLLSISEYSRQEAIDTLNIDVRKIVSISTANTEHFVNSNNVNVDSIKEKFNIKNNFIMHNSTFEERKNFDGLMRAYALLPESVRSLYCLVLVGKKNDYCIYTLKPLAQKLGISKNVIFTDYVTDEELIGLFSASSLFVFPSIHEGFGLPALEAMACGTPTIGANCTSIPEVIGREDALFDPYNVESIAALIERALTDEEYRQSLKKHGLEQAKKFSWDKSAKRAIEAMEQHFDNSEDNLDNSRVEDSTEVFYNDLISEIADIVYDKKNIEDYELKIISISINKNITSASRVNRLKGLKDKLTWRIEGPFDSSYSLALLNRETASALDKLGHHVILHSTDGPGDFLPKQEFLDDNLDLNEMYLRCSSMPHEQCDVVSRNLYPPRVGDMNGNMNILHHYAWEESAFPQDWVDSFNNYLHGITCLSKHVEKVMTDNGVSIPLSTSGCGVGHWERIEPEKNWKTPGKKFKFLHVSSCFPRKGADVMLKAYGKAFTNSDDISLIIKTFQNPHNEIHKWLREARVAYKNYPHVEIIEKDITDSELKALYTQCDALVAPSRAEGFGLPMAEAMLSGLPVITTGWSGQMDFCNNDTSWLIDYTFAPASTHFNLFDSVWAEPDENHLTELMRQIYNLPLEKRKEKAQKVRELLLNNFKWSDVAERLVNSVRSFAANPLEPELRIGWITTWNTRCGIATYSAHLIDNMDYPVTAILAAHTNDLTAQDQDNVERCWKADNNDSLDNLGKTIDSYDLNTLVIQFNLYFFNYNRLSYFIESQINKGRIVVITLHATFDPENDPSKKLEFLREALLKCHRILVHSLKDLNRLKDLWLIDNVALFPHGLIDIAPEEVSLKIPSGRFVMASYGFFLPNKGLLELIEAVSILAKKKIDVHLLMVNAEYPNPISNEIIAEGKRLISKLGIKERVTLITDFLPDEISLGYLRKADLILFPYQKTGESASGAIRYGLASKIPVAVTPLSIFEDVDKAVYKLPGITPEEISKGVIDYIHALKNGDDKVKEIQKIAEGWRESHLYSNIAKRLKGILYGLLRSSQMDNGTMPQYNKKIPVDLVEYIETQIESFINEVEKKSFNDDDFRYQFSKFVLKLPKMTIPGDPFSQEYYDFQMKLYSLISKKDYNAIESEQSDFEINCNRPFPYYTESANTISDQLLAIGFIIKTVNLPPKAKILEFGPGWGNTTIQLALAGYNVTAVEIGAMFCDLLEYRKIQHGLNNFTIIQQDMVEYSTRYSLKDYDVILFYESFHHCWAHKTLCSNFKNMLKDDGKVIFAAEPILEKSDHFPYPWGVRIDGMSIWSTRKFGWLELGFEMHYFSDLMLKNGFKLEEKKSDVSPLTRILIAKQV